MAESVEAAAALRAELAQLAAERSDVDNRLRHLQGPPGGRGRGRATAVAPRAPFQPQRSQLLSAVVADAAPPGDVAVAAVGAAPEDAKLKRPVREEESNPDQQKRARRMLGSLLGTLHKFRQEEGAAVRQELVAKRASILQRAEDKERGESRRLRDLERSTMDDRLREEKQRRSRLNALMQEKRIRLTHVTWVANQECAYTFLQTATLPALLYLPARLNKEAQEALDGRHAKLAEFRSVELPAAAAVVEERIRALHASRGASPVAMEAGEIAGEEEGQVPSHAPRRKPPADAAQGDMEVDDLEDETAAAKADPETLQDLLA